MTGLQIFATITLVWALGMILWFLDYKWLGVVGQILATVGTAIMIIILLLVVFGIAVGAIK